MFVSFPHLLESDEEFTINQSESLTGKLGLLNHENTSQNYSITTWLLNQSQVYNDTTAMNETIIHHFLFLDNHSVFLNDTRVDLSLPLIPQWVTNISYVFDDPGQYHLIFLVHTSPLQHFTKYEEYQYLAELLRSTADVEQDYRLLISEGE